MENWNYFYNDPFNFDQYNYLESASWIIISNYCYFISKKFHHKNEEMFPWSYNKDKQFYVILVNQYPLKILNFVAFRFFPSAYRFQVLILFLDYVIFFYLIFFQSVYLQIFHKKNQLFFHLLKYFQFINNHISIHLIY